MDWIFPIALKPIGITSDSQSFKNINLNEVVEIPVGCHVGSFGYVRKHDIHKGVDLYCPEDTKVFAVESGIVRQIRWFTGPNAGHDWWRNTMAISIEGASGVIVYGEVEPSTNLVVGQSVSQGEVIAVVKPVLLVDKGRPMSMLHFAMHHHGVLSNGVWEIGKSQPIGLIDPTNYLLRASQLGSNS